MIRKCDKHGGSIKLRWLWQHDSFFSQQLQEHCFLHWNSDFNAENNNLSGGYLGVEYYHRITNFDTFRNRTVIRCAAHVPVLDIWRRSHDGPLEMQGKLELRIVSLTTTKIRPIKECSFIMTITSFSSQTLARQYQTLGAEWKKSLSNNI